ncbi:hypothetical protein FZI85_06135 [Mycobacterium sp. CBMA293]|uniref:hypothetical protein n=1 Tax=unclassified Mycolicibacterium TaxID=2636767 RepID=UPI00132A8983|nr:MULTISPECIES: hypothetical protein [unclassified Mycolicibacterium]MUL45150.1 hypothetical protein [Mycolicibacterium sp. CBMA 360]MUL91755.1 hypothetical protein [Mycolicibacterium sp. CBMA 230]MUL56668.1 hypothetical protein [Mycolicibacterium sp. CBMA 335]MUL69707.1 hypothetical protein [Mycolicibacterium sp. CBMA 311]MUM05494.1 hypothetical protein [Mycolicibacterium sp. CBMA 213]
MSITDEFLRARALMFAADEPTAKELLLSLMPAIEAADRDDQMLEVFAQLGEIYLVRSALDGVRECIRRTDECLDIYASIRAGQAPPEIVAQLTMSPEDVDHMVCRYRRRAKFLQAGLCAAIGDHEGAAQALIALGDSMDTRYPDLDDEHIYLLTHARVVCALALCDDDLHVRSVPLWEQVLAAMAAPADDAAREYLWLTGALGYARFCTETGRVAEALPWLRRAEARAQTRGWELATARAQLERAAVSWATGDREGTEALVTAAYPEIARQARAHEVSRSWLYFGLTRLAAGALEAADECWGHAERHWRELGKPLHVHRILLQRSWIAIFRGRYEAARGLVAEARDCLDSSPRSSWLQYARLDDQLGTVWRAEALADLGFDAAGTPTDTWQQAETRYREALGVWSAEPGTDQYRSGMAKLATAADLKIPAALAVDSVRYSITDADARSRWATGVAAPLLAGAFAVAWESQDSALVGELIEYHSARGAFSVDAAADPMLEWSRVSTTAAPAIDVEQLAPVAAGPVSVSGGGLTRLGPLPPLQMEPGDEPVLARFRELAQARYGRAVTADQDAWSTCP